MRFEEEKVKKRTLFFLSVCAVALKGYVVHADAENVTPQNAIVGVVANTSGQLSVEQENSYSTTLENVTEETESGSEQLNSTSSTVVSSSSSIDLQVEEEVRSNSEEADSSNHASTFNLSDLSDGTGTSGVSELSTDTSTSSFTASSTKASIPNPSTRASTKSVISSVTETSSSTSSTQVGTSLRSMPRTTSLSGNVSVSNVNAQSGSFDVHVTNVSAPRGLSKVLVPTWTESNGQDDIIYHTADRQSDGSYKVTVPNSKHKYGTGKYNIHLYYRGTDGSMTYVAQTTTTLPELKTSGNVSVSNVNAQSGSFDVHVTNVSAPRGLSKVLVPTWTESDGQDDIIYHTADRQSDGSYKVTVPNSKHKYGTGKYNIHLYYRGTDGSMTYVAQTTTNLPQSSAKGTISAELVDATKGTFSVSVSNIVGAEPIKDVEVAVWSEKNNQDDLKSYSANRKSDGTYHVEVAKGLHRNDTGTYHIEVYYRYANTRDLIGSTTVDVPSTRSYTVYIDPGHGGVDSGASYGGVYEKNLALSVANKLKANLIQLGYQVLMTRTADYNVDFKTERSKMANQSNADLFISIHFNATGLASSNATGIETYWYQYDPEYQPKINAAMHNDPTRLAESEILANQVQTSLISGTGAVNRGVRRDTFAVLRETAIPAILVELGFMDNPSDLQKINQDSYQTKLAKALAQGIDNWYGAVGSKPTSGTSTQKKSTEQSQLTTSEQSFFKNILPAIQQVSQKKGIVTSVMLAQSILESGWGTSQLAKNAYNIFGIKADSSWKGNTYTVQTKEVVNGKTITVEKQFRAYKSLLESISDYGSFFTSTAWRIKNYASFLQATNYETALTSLLASGYATDPAYAEKLKSLIQRYGLDQYDLN
ncbi:GBS Bsp-like repeat-containing protein [Streptococcus suis]|nr:GBS Bsp-like repeat-containing protein [Streptococcus suis]